MSKTSKQLFEDLSKVLTGENALDPALVPTYYDRLAAVYPIEMPDLLKRFEALTIKDEADVTANILKNGTTPKEVLALMKEIVNIWYLGSFFTPDISHRMMPPKSVQQYQGQLMYSMIKAPLRGYSNLAGAQYGYWVTKPAGE